MDDHRTTSRLRFHKGPATTRVPAQKHPVRRFVLGQRKTVTANQTERNVSGSAVNIKTKSRSEVLMQRLLVNPQRIRVEDSLYHQICEEGVKKSQSKAQRASGGGNVPGGMERSAHRIVLNTSGDAKAAVRNAGKAARRVVASIFRAPFGRKKKAPLPRSQKTSFLRELLRMGMVAGGTFAVAMLIMNLNAYSSIAQFYYQKLAGTNEVRERLLTNLVADPNPPLPNETKTDERLSAGEKTAPLLPRAGIDRAPLTLDVTPNDNRIVIPKIGKNVPIVEVPERNLIKQNWKALEEDIQHGLSDGVVHYPGTAKPHQAGNFFITGHSSFYSWVRSKYKDVFALLPQVEVGDRVTVYYDQNKYTYEIISKKTVPATDTAPLKATNDRRVTIMTCVPIGTDLNRLILVGKLIEG